MTATSLWLGPYPSEANAAYRRARESGLSQLRAMVVANIASFKDGWAFRSKLAGQVGCSVRTVQRALTQAKLEGLIGVARCKKEEVPPGAKAPIPCGWSHRWTIGWGKAGEAVKQAVDAAKARQLTRWLLKKVTSPARSVAPEANSAWASTTPIPDTLPTGGRRRRWTPEELDAELARIPVTLVKPHDPPT